MKECVAIKPSLQERLKAVVGGNARQKLRSTQAALQMSSLATAWNEPEKRK